MESYANKPIRSGLTSKEMDAKMDFRPSEEFFTVRDLESADTTNWLFGTN